MKIMLSIKQKQQVNILYFKLLILYRMTNDDAMLNYPQGTNV